MARDHASARSTISWRRWRCRRSARRSSSARRASPRTSTTPRRCSRRRTPPPPRTRRRSPRRAPRRRGLAQAARDQLAAEAEAKRKALDEELAAKFAEAESQIAATRAQAMANVGAIARDAAGAIVERLIGRSGQAGGDRRRGRFAESELSGSSSWNSAPNFSSSSASSSSSACSAISACIAWSWPRSTRAARRSPTNSAEAAKLRAEATALLESFEKKTLEAEANAAAIVAEARAQAEHLAKETAERMNDFVARRTKQAEAKIALAETQAAADVRAAAADHAAKAAEIVLRARDAGRGRRRTGGARNRRAQGPAELTRGAAPRRPLTPGGARAWWRARRIGESAMKRIFSASRRCSLRRGAQRRDRRARRRALCPYTGVLAACDDPASGAISDRFAQKESAYWNSSMRSPASTASTRSAIAPTGRLYPAPLLRRARVDGDRKRTVIYDIDEASA